MKQLLPDIHNSPDTAYVIEDYPYGFRLRCKMRMWIETRPKFGQRVMSQTTNPKLDSEHWNKPKGSIYCGMQVLFIDDDGHVNNDGIHAHSGPESIMRFRNEYYSQMSDSQKSRFEAMEKFSRKMSPVSWEEWEEKQTQTV